MNIEYDRIITKIKEARQADNKKSIKIWRKKLENWQLKYGAYAPIQQR